jgi:hypothetical protein
MSRGASGRIATAVLVLSLLGAAAVLADQAVLWTRSYDGDGNFNDWALSVALSGDNVYSSGYLRDAAGFDNGAFFIHRKDGTKLYEATFDGYGQDDEMRVVEVDGSGDVFVFGYAQRNDENGTKEGVLQRRDAAGTLRFERRIPPPAGYDSFDARGMHVGGDTVYFIGTVTDSSGTSLQAIYVGAAPSGDNTTPLRWEQVITGSLGGPASGSNLGRLIAGGGNLLYVGGTVLNASGTGNAMYLARIHPDNGAIAWDNATDNPSGDEISSRLYLAGNDVLLSGGRPESDGSQSAVLFCRDGSTGALIWESTVANARVTMIQNPVSFSITGSTVHAASSLDNGFVAVAAYRLADGAVLWTRTDGIGGQESVPGSVLFDGTRIAVAGVYPADALTVPSAGVMYYDTAGVFLQKVLVPRAAGATTADQVLSAATDNAGNVFLAGSIDTPLNGGDYLVARFGTAPPPTGGVAAGDASRFPRARPGHPPHGTG